MQKMKNNVNKSTATNANLRPNTNGITLIALTITIIIIIILATVAISFVFGENGLINRAQDAGKMYANDTEYTEGSIANVQAYINDILIGTGGSEDSGDNPGEPDEPEIPIRPTGTISFTNPNWVGDGTATVVITTDNATDELQYQINGKEDDKWEPIESGEIISGLKHNDTVYGRLWNGTEGTDPASTSILDRTPPSVSISTSGLSYTSVTLNVTASDGESGLAESGAYTYYLNNSQVASNNTNSYNYPGLSEGSSYTLKVVVKDKAGLTTEQSTTITTQSRPTVGSTLSAGQYVYYVDGTGATRKCAVLYGNNSGYGLQIITMEPVEQVQLRGMQSYNNAIEELNSATSRYLNTTYASSVRCVGSMPNNSSYDTAGWYYGAIGEYNGQLRNSDNNYLNDYNAMTSLGILNIGKSYWLASRNVENIEGGDLAFYARYVSYDGSLTWCNMCVYTNRFGFGSLDEIGVYFGLRPVFTLRSNVKITGGSGTSSNPYTLGV